MKSLTNFIKKLFLSAKKNWQILLLVLGTIFAYIFFRRQEVNFDARLNDIRKAHGQQLQEIQDAHADEIKRRQENERLLKIALEEIQKKYGEAMKKLDEKKKKEIKKIVEEHGRDPEALADRLSSATGFKIVLPLED